MPKPFPHLLVLESVVNERYLIGGLFIILGLASLAFRSQLMAFGSRVNQRFGLLPYNRMNPRLIKIATAWQVFVALLLVVLGLLICLGLPPMR